MYTQPGPGRMRTSISVSSLSRTERKWFKNPFWLMRLCRWTCRSSPASTSKRANASDFQSWWEATRNQTGRLPARLTSDPYVASVHMTSISRSPALSRILKFCRSNCCCCDSSSCAYQSLVGEERNVNTRVGVGMCVTLTVPFFHQARRMDVSREENESSA